MIALPQILELALDARFDPQARDVLRDVLEERYGDAFTSALDLFADYADLTARWPTPDPILAVMLDDECLPVFHADPHGGYRPFYLAILHLGSRSRSDTLPTHGGIPDVIVATWPPSDLTTAAYEREHLLAGGQPSRYVDVHPHTVSLALQDRARRNARRRRWRT